MSSTDRAWNAQPWIHWEYWPKPQASSLVQVSPDASFPARPAPFVRSCPNKSLLLARSSYFVPEVLGTTTVFYVYQAGAALWASLLCRPHLPPSHAQTHAHRPVLLHRRSPIVARLVHFSSQCVRGLPTRLKHPCYPIRCIVLSQETALNLSTSDAIIIYNGNLVGELDR